MKKIVLTLCVIVSLYSCKKQTEKKQINAYRKTTKNVLPTEDSLIKLAAYLKEHDDEICPGIDSLDIDKNHLVTDIEFNNMLINFWGPNHDEKNTPKKEIPFEDIVKIMTTNKCYDEYIGFKTDSLKQDAKIGLEIIPLFTLKRPCYSKPLFRSIERKLSLTSKSIFKFYKAKNNNKFTVIFMVIDNNNGVEKHFDLSVWP